MLKSSMIAMALVSLTGLHIGSGLIEQAIAPSVSADERTTYFTNKDFQAFDRYFHIDNERCTVGLEGHDLCFKKTANALKPFEGETLPVPASISRAELETLLVLSPKDYEKVIVTRIGTTLALVSRSDETVVDVLELTENNFAGR